MSGYYDVYVLAPHRSADTVARFLDAFAPRREQSAAEYCFPQYSDRPQIILTDAQGAIGYYLDHPSEAQSMYFRNAGDGAAHVMLFFTEDRELILGLSVGEAEADDALRRLGEHAGSQVGYVTFEEPPPATACEFRRLARDRT